MHKNLTLVGLGAVGGFLAGRYPRETRAALNGAAERLQGTTGRMRGGRDTAVTTVVNDAAPEPFPTWDPESI